MFAVQTVCVRGKHLTVEPCNYSHKHTCVGTYVAHTYIYIYVVRTCMWLERGALPLKTFHFRSTVQLKCMQQDAQETLRKVLSLSFFWFPIFGHRM